MAIALGHLLDVLKMEGYQAVGLVKDDSGYTIQWQNGHNPTQEEQANALALLESYQLPDLDGFVNAIWNDSNLIAVRNGLILWKPLMVDYLGMGIEGVVRIQEAWQGIKAQLDGVNPAIAPLVLGHAQAYHIPLE